MEFFMPYWEDKLDPGFNFITDSFSKVHVQYGPAVDKYIHELIDPPYDGILFSLGVFLEKMSLNNDGQSVDIKGHPSLRSYLRLDNPHRLKLMGDCGAFNYVNEPEPPEQFNPMRVASLYHILGMDYGISVDHLVVKTIKVPGPEGRLVKKELSRYEMRKRIKLSLDYAQKFLDISKSNNYQYVPVGSAQGYSPKTYRDSVAQLVEMGYDYIALGGLVRSTTKEIVDVLRTVHPVLKGRRLHLLGILRPNSLQVFQTYGVSSFDSASYLRKAWLRSGQNYLSHDLSKWYTAIRIPQTENPRMIASATEAGWSLSEVEKLETECLTLLRKYDFGLVPLEKVLGKVLLYDSLYERNGDDGRGLESRYMETLSERPWTKCNCKLCQSLGIDIILFRGTNRNKRRGFHNNAVFYRYLKNMNGQTGAIVAD